MDMLTEVGRAVVVLGPAGAVLTYAAGAKSRHRNAIRETLELVERLEHNPELAQRMRDSADALAEEYLKETDAPELPMPVSIGAWVIAFSLLIVLLATHQIPKDQTFGDDVVYGLILGGASLALGDPVSRVYGRFASRRRRSPEAAE